MTTIRRSRPALATAIALPALALLSGCTLGIDTDRTGERRGATSSPSPSASPSAGTGELASVADTALDAVGSGRILSIEQEGSGTWEVVVADDEGVETEIHLRADGGIVAGPETDRTDDEDRAENTALLDGASLDHAEAASRLLATRDGRLTELSLDDRRSGAIVWEGDVVATDGARFSVAIDASTGAVVENGADRSN